MHKAPLTQKSQHISIAKSELAFTLLPQIVIFSLRVKAISTLQNLISTTDPRYKTIDKMWLG